MINFITDTVVSVVVTMCIGVTFVHLTSAFGVPFLNDLFVVFLRIQNILGLFRELFAVWIRKTCIKFDIAHPNRRSPS